MFIRRWIPRSYVAVIGILCTFGVIQLLPALITKHNNNNLNSILIRLSDGLVNAVYSEPNLNLSGTASTTCSYPWATSEGRLRLTDSPQTYFLKLGSLLCFSEGTDFGNRSSPVKDVKVPLENVSFSCPCLRGWHGVSCSIPDIVIHSNFPKKKFLSSLKPRINIPVRKIIHAFPFNSEFELLEARLAELYDIVDVFMILESNYTAFGKPKPLRLLERLKAGYYKEYACKIVHVFLDFFPVGAEKNGWMADNILRNYISKHGLVKQLYNYKSDDIFLLTDADELPHKEAVWFLKLHDGYPEPIGIFLRGHIFGFFWKSRREHVHVICAVSIGVLTRVLKNQAINIRTADFRLKQNKAALAAYIKKHNSTHINLWSFGTGKLPAGWHCTSCCPPECVRDKLLSAQNGDFPRWGNDPKTTNVTYIKHLIRHGLWFDGKGKQKPNNATGTEYAPEYFLNNFEKYKHLLVNPYINT